MSSPEGSSRPPSEPERGGPLDDQRSVSDGDLDAERKKRRIRRRRGNRGRFKPYDLVDNEEASTSEASPTEKKLRTRKGQPMMAPRNTTQFLLHDMEERAEAEREVEAAHCAEGRARVRSLSVGSEFLQHSLSDEESDSSVVSDANHREFETELEEFNIERISHLTRDEMAREILDKDKEAEVYHDGLLRVNRENERLRRLLKDNGIPIEQTEKSPTSQPQAVS